ncbi:MAG: hypothetical protein KGJ94_08530 [Xanthomonadaceae bacterium]|nr:hypothetical protein [Xanthomonadaceae bacterium]
MSRFSFCLRKWRVTQGLCIALALAGFSQQGAAQLAPPPGSPGSEQVAAFLGTWCAQGDPAKQASIASSGPGSNGAFLTLTNENGDSSPGNLQGTNQVVAPGWQFVVGTLSSDGSQINWSNGTMWARCPSGGGRWPGDFPRLAGTWFANGDRTRACTIRQHRGALELQNEVGQSASGRFVRRHLISTIWNGSTIQGRISRDGNRIDWSNGTSWIRDVVY